MVQQLRTGRLFSSTSTPVVELREYLLSPSKAIDYVKATADTSELRKSLVPLRLFAMPDTGGMLNKAVHFYDYRSLQEREDKRGVMAQNADWQSYLKLSRPCCETQHSSIWVEAPFVRESNEWGMKVASLDGSASANTVYELRRYKLELGYDTVPKFLSHYEKGLPSKLEAAEETQSSSFCSLMYSEVGMTNEVIEIWRHDGAEGMERTREASRDKTLWREAIGNIAPLGREFTSMLVRPTTFSNWR